MSRKACPPKTKTERMTLSGRDAAMLLDLLSDPPEANEKLKKAAERFGKVAR